MPNLRLERAPLVISIQSQVVHGHVGNSAAVFPMQAAGLEVAAIPTVLLSNPPIYPTLRGRALPSDLLADLLLGAEERGLTERADIVLSGYLGTVDAARIVAGFVARAKAINPGLRYICDPVMGEAASGLYIPAALAVAIRDDLLPLADIVLPNQFELGWIADHPVGLASDVIVAADRVLRFGPDWLIATGCLLDDTGPGTIECLGFGREGMARHPAPRLAANLSGSGDLFAGLFTAWLARGRPVSAAVATAHELTALALQHALMQGARHVSLSHPEFRRRLLDA